MYLKNKLAPIRDKIFLAYQNKAFSIRFVDEEQNFVLGNFVAKKEKLYSDLFANHQPVTFILSGTINSLTDPNSIYLLVKRH